MRKLSVYWRTGVSHLVFFSPHNKKFIILSFKKLDILIFTGTNGSPRRRHVRRPHCPRSPAWGCCSSGSGPGSGLGEKTVNPRIYQPITIQA